MKTLADLKLEYRREFGEYADDDHWAYQEWLEEKVLAQMNKECTCVKEIPRGEDCFKSLSYGGLRLDVVVMPMMDPGVGKILLHPEDANFLGKSMHNYTGISGRAKEVHISEDFKITAERFREIWNKNMPVTSVSHARHYPLTPREALQKESKVPSICTACQCDFLTCKQFPENDTDCRGLIPIPLE